MMTGLIMQRALNNYGLVVFGDRFKDIFKKDYIAGSNVAMEHGGPKIFPCKGLHLCVDHFWGLGHPLPYWFQRRGDVCLNLSLSPYM